MNEKDFSEPLYDAVGIGCVYIDVIADVSHDFLETYGIPLDTGRFFDEETIGRIKAELKNPVFLPGGTVPNTLAGLSALGGRIGSFGKVAADEAGHAFLKDLAARRIDNLTPGFVEGAPYSGTCLVLLTGGNERSFALHKGCMDRFTPDDFSSFDFASAATALFNAELLSNEEARPVIAEAMRRAAATPCKVVLSLSEMREWDGMEELIRETLVPCADVVIGNEAERDIFFGIAGPPRDERLLVLTTHGERGASARRGKEPETRVPALKVEPFVNTLGAGDQFLAGFVHGDRIGMTLEESLKLGVRCASAIIKETGARPAPGVSWRHLV